MVPSSYLQVGSKIQLKAGKIANAGLVSHFSPTATVTITASLSALGPFLSVSGPLFIGLCNSFVIDFTRLANCSTILIKNSALFSYSKISGTLVNGGYFLVNVSVSVASEQASSQSLLSVQRFLDQVRPIFCFPYIFHVH